MMDIMKRAREKYRKHQSKISDVERAFMKCYICTDHDGFGFGTTNVASIVIAENEEDARGLLDEELVALELEPYKDFPYTLIEVGLSVAKAIILNDGGPEGGV